MYTILNLKSLASPACPEYNDTAKAVFHRDAKIFLKSVAVQLGLSSSQFDLRNNKAGHGVSGEITMHSDNLYIQVSWHGSSNCARVMYRTCDHRKDYSGHTNRFVLLRNLVSDAEQNKWVTELKSLNAHLNAGTNPNPGLSSHAHAPFVTRVSAG